MVTAADALFQIGLREATAPPLVDLVAIVAVVLLAAAGAATGLVALRGLL
jgi:hypothetical protein